MKHVAICDRRSFGLIVGLFSVYTGRATRNYSGALIKEEGRRAQELIERHEEKTPEKRYYFVPEKSFL